MKDPLSAYPSLSHEIPSHMPPPSKNKEKGLTEHKNPIFVSNRIPSIQSLSKAIASDRFPQVADKSIFIGLIRTKINEVSKEVETKKYG
jgi:hypothetical protein